MAAKIKRVFMLVKRGLTDNTPTCCYPWEKPMLESIHGGNAIEVPIEDLLGTQGAAGVKALTLPRQDDKTIPALSPRDQYEAMLMVSDADNPMADPQQEWNRLIEKYGMDAELPVTVAEKVYGGYRQFRTALKDFAAGRVPDFLSDSDADPIEGTEEKVPSEMSAAELKEELTRRGLMLSGKPSKADLVEALTEAMVEAA